MHPFKVDMCETRQIHLNKTHLTLGHYQSLRRLIPFLLLLLNHGRPLNSDADLALEVASMACHPSYIPRVSSIAADCEINATCLIVAYG